MKGPLVEVSLKSCLVEAKQYNITYVCKQIWGLDHSSYPLDALFEVEFLH
jgi:hypothetical protein